MYKNNNTTQGGKYKTTMCKHYNTQKGCSYGEKCQFAHGDSDLRGFGQGNNFSTMSGMGGMSSMGGMGMNTNMNYAQNQNSNFQQQKKVPNPANFKIVKCKNFDRDGQCKYGNTCTFAHGDAELRAKVDNSMFSGSNMNQMGFNPYMMDPNMVMYMNSMGYPSGDMSQMQMMGGMDPSGFNMNATNTTTPSTGTSNEMNNMGYYPYPGQSSTENN